MNEESAGAPSAAGREVVAHEPEREREHRPAGALDDASDDEHRQRRGQPRDHAADREQGEDGEQGPAFAPQVADASGDGGRDGGGQQVAGDDPAGVGRRGAQVTADRGQRGGDHGLQGGVRHAARGEHGEHGRVAEPGDVASPRHDYGLRFDRTRLPEAAK